MQKINTKCYSCELYFGPQVWQEEKAFYLVEQSEEKLNTSKEEQNADNESKELDYHDKNELEEEEESIEVTTSNQTF